MGTEFDAAYNRLNTQQKEAVDTIEGPVMVIAGPGTGKTQVLATRIGQLLRQTDVESRNILALTFTDAAATTMRQRLATLIGPAAYSVQIATFHAFCAQVLAEHPEFFPVERDSQPITELERHEILGELLEKLPLEELRPLNRPNFYVKDCVRAISQLKRENVSPDTLRELVQNELSILEQGISKVTAAKRRIQEKRVQKQAELATVYAGYEERLRLAHRFDFDDMISFVVTAFKTDSLLLQEYQELIHYILVDEFQDTNTAQNQIVDLLGSYWGDAANIFVVGDPHQSIFRFQGASMENMLRFSASYPSAKIVTLTDGYRCGQNIYAAAQKLLLDQPIAIPESVPSGVAQSISDSLGTQLQSMAAVAGTVKCAQLPTQTAEQLYIVACIKQLLNSGAALSDIAVLYRTNADGLALEKVFSVAQIRYQIERGANALDVPLIQQIIQLFSVLLKIRNGQDSDCFAVLCFAWVDVEKLPVYKLARQAAQSKRSILNLAQLSWKDFKEQQAGFDVAEHISENEFAGVHSLVEQWQSWIVMEPTLPFSHWFSLLLEQTKIIEWMLQQPESQELLKALQGLHACVAAAVSNNHAYALEDFVRSIAVMQAQGIAIRQEDIRTTAEAVTLSTAHSAKGKEWRHVFIYNCIDTQWGGSKSVDKLRLPDSILQFADKSEIVAQTEADDRRLFYVALTRAQESVTITYPEFKVSESKQKSLLASRFLASLNNTIEFVSTEEINSFGVVAESQIPDLLKPAPLPSRSEILQNEREFFAHLIETFALSVSALNRYLVDPSTFRDTDLLRVPSSADAYLSYGSAMHRALELWQRPVLTGSQPASIETVLQEFDKALKQEVMVPEEFERRQSKGRKVLREFLAFAAQDMQSVFSVERKFGSLRSPVYLDDIPLKGRIDRLDWIDKSKKLVRVIDYKTGKPKTDGQILATVASAELSLREQSLPETIRSPMQRQLVFYKLLAELDPSFSGTVTHGQFVFVEPTASVKTPFVHRQYEITDTAVQDLKQLIRDVMAEIRALRFLDVEAQ